MNNGRVNDDFEDETIASSKVNKIGDRWKVEVQAPPKAYSFSKPFPLRILNFIFRVSLKIIKIVFFVGLSAGILVALYYFLFSVPPLLSPAVRYPLDP